MLFQGPCRHVSPLCELYSRLGVHKVFVDRGTCRTLYRFLASPWGPQEWLQLPFHFYRPNFGSRLSELAFSPLNNDTLLRIRLYVREALEVWEPRIIVEEVLTEPDPVRGKVNININYRLKDIPDIHSFVYPYYLLSSGE